MCPTKINRLSIIVYTKVSRDFTLSVILSLSGHSYWLRPIVPSKERVLKYKPKTKYFTIFVLVFTWYYQGLPFVLSSSAVLKRGRLRVTISDTRKRTMVLGLTK